VKLMAVDGETAPRLGEKFRLRCKTLVRSLGYVERIDRKFGLDLGVDPPPPQKNLRRPSFSPSGRTAIDFKEGLSVQIVKEAKKLNDKITELNRAGNPEFSDIVGGILITDIKIGITNLRRTSNNGVFCWDSRYMHFLAKKTAVFHDLLKSNSEVRENQLDDWTTFFMIFEPFPGFVQVKAYIFYHNPLLELTSQVAEAILARFSEKISDYDSMKIRIIIHLQLHSIAEITEGGEEKFKELTTGSITDFVGYESQQCWTVDYNLAPWFVYCRENRL
jgi:hypothetical protein